ncbi:MAG: Pvc16 family protein [Sphingomonas sp.]
MAQHQAIAAAAAAIRGLLRERYPRDAFDTLTVEMYQAKDIEKGLTVDGFAILPWRVAINTQRRARAPRVDIFGRRFRPSLPLDLSFLIIPVASSTEKQLRMLGWMMRALEDAGSITAAQLNDYLTEDSIFSVEEDLDLVCDPLSVVDQLSMWDRIRRHPLFVNYLVRMVLIDSNQALDDTGIVLERGFGVGIAEDVA